MSAPSCLRGQQLQKLSRFKLWLFRVTYTSQETQRRCTNSSWWSKTGKRDARDENVKIVCSHSQLLRCHLPWHQPALYVQQCRPSSNTAKDNDHLQVFTSDFWNGNIMSCNYILLGWLWWVGYFFVTSHRLPRHSFSRQALLLVTTTSLNTVGCSFDLR